MSLSEMKDRWLYVFDLIVVVIICINLRTVYEFKELYCIDLLSERSLNALYLLMSSDISFSNFYIL